MTIQRSTYVQGVYVEHFLNRQLVYIKSSDESTMTMKVFEQLGCYRKCEYSVLLMFKNVRISVWLFLLVTVSLGLMTF